MEALTRSAQDAIGETNRFRREEERTADAGFPESRRWYVGVLLGLVVLETLINGFFFGTNVTSGLFGGMSYAVLISAVNVLILGFLAAAAIRQIHHRDPRRKLVGLMVVVSVACVALFWNVLVAHYREALPSDFPPAPATLTAASSEAEQEVAACWLGPDEADADREALCLFRGSWFGLGGFQSYMLLLIGLAMWAFATLDWLRMDDPYPGYGKRERARRDTEDALFEDRSELLAKLKQLHDDALGRQRSDFRDPVEARELAISDFEKLGKRHRDLCSFVHDLEESCSRALDIYRTANREARSTPDPGYWSDSWASGWSLPEPPRESTLMTEAEAEQRSRAANAALRDREQKLRECHDKCQKFVNEFTKLDQHDQAVPA